MRLTDKPRSLADVKPEVAWPAALQATLDRALARDTDDRYTSAAAFGREFAAAIADMPMTQAVEAGTMVMNAAASGKQNVPETRVNAPRPSAKTLPMEAPAEARKPAARAAAAPAPAPSGSKVPMIAGVGGGLAAVVGVGLYLSGMFNGAKPVDPSGTGGDTARQVALVPPAVKTDSGAQSPPGGNPTSTQTQPLNAPGTAMPNTTPGKAPGTKAPTTPATSTKAPAPSTTPPATPTVSAAADLEKWLDEAQQPNATRSTLRRIVADVEALRPNLRGLMLAESWYVEMIARGASEDTGACAAARKVKELHTDRTRVTAANITLDDESCKPAP